MNKTFKIYGIIFAIVLFLLALLELGKKEVTDWRKNFEVSQKSPFGLFIFNKEATKLLGENLKRTIVSPYNYYSEQAKQNPHNILAINQKISSNSWDKILEQVNQGSDALIISEYFPEKIEDSLGFYAEQKTYEERLNLFLTDDKFRQDSLVINKLPGNVMFHEIDKNIEILGGSSNQDYLLGAHFIKINFGKGHLYMHSEPLFITNFYLLKKGNEKYAQNVFSYLPERETVWFIETNDVRSQSPLRFILSKPPLRYAWWLFLAALAIFIFFNFKRKQRIVPIIEPLKNTSVEFVKSIGNLYLQEGDFHDMMAKKSQYFLSKIRMELLIDTQHLDENFIKKLQSKTGKPIEKIIEAVALIKKGQDPYSYVTKEDLFKLNTLLDEILKL